MTHSVKRIIRQKQPLALRQMIAVTDGRHDAAVWMFDLVARMVDAQKNDALNVEEGDNRTHMPPPHDLCIPEGRARAIVDLWMQAEVIRPADVDGDTVRTVHVDLDRLAELCANPSATNVEDVPAGTA